MSDLPAGRELDALMAERVMGMQRPTKNLPWPEHFAGALGRYENPETANLAWYPTTTGYDSGDEPTWLPKPYSTDIAAAMELVNHCMNCPAIPEHKRQVGIDAFLIRGEWTWRVTLREGTGAEAETAPLAICRAALKAVGA